MQANRPQQLTLLAFAVSTVLGGNNAIAVRASNMELPPFFGAGVRFAAAAMLLLAAAVVLRLPLPSRRAFAGAMIFGALQFGVSYALIYWSLSQVQAGLFQVVFAVVPILTFVIAILHRQESFQVRVLAGGLLAIGGITVVFADRLGTSLTWGALFAILLAAACVSESVVLLKTFPRAHPVTTNVVAMATGSVILLALSWLWQESPTVPTQASTWIALVYLVMLGSVATFVLALYVLARWTASATSYQLVLMPIVTVLFASWLAGEAVTVGIVVGGLLVLVGVYVGAIAPPGLFERILKRLPGRAQ